MPEWLKELLEKAEVKGKVHVVEIKPDEPKDKFAEIKEEAKKIAQTNKILYEAHIDAGFTKNEALALTRTVIGI